MKQLLQNLHTGETTVAEVPIPTPQPGAALVRTATSLVSTGTERMVVEFAEKSLLNKARSRPDLVRQVLNKAQREGLLTTMQAAFNRLDQPMPLGYASAGTIVALGESVSGLYVGQRVACAGGAYAVHAEYGAIPRNLLTLLPENVDFESAAFTTLGAIALHGFRLLQAQIGERVAIIGLGLLGLLAVEIAAAAGCQVLGIDLDPQRVALAKKLGAKAVLREQAVEASQSFSNGRGCDAVLICADTPSADPVELAGTIARDRARVVAVGAVGLHLPRKIYYEKELTFINSRSYGPGRYDPTYEEAGQDYPIGYVRWTEGRNLEAFVELLSAGRVDVHPLITHRFPIEQAPQAYELITGKHNEPFLGVLLTYKEESGIPGKSGPISSTLILNDTKRTDPETSESTTGIPETPKLGSSAMVKLGLLGAGSFALTVMLPAVKKIPYLELVGVVSASGVNAKHAANRFGFRYAASDEARLIADPDINTIAILTRHHLHARQVLASLQAGKHVFCEKPLAINHEQLAEIEDRLALINERQLLVTVGFNRRFAPLSQRLHAFLLDRSEPLVAHYRVNAGYIPPNHWLHDPSLGGGRIIGEGCHFIDFLTHLAGAPPNSVSVHGLPNDGRYQEDNVVLTLTFPDGSLGTVSYLANGDKTFPKERIEVFAGGRVAVLDDFRSLETVHAGRRQMFRSHLRQDKGHRAAWEAFVKAIVTGGQPPIPYNQLFGVAQATFAAVESLRSGNEVIITRQD